jgi:hypothetical protein
MTKQVTVVKQENFVTQSVVESRVIETSSRVGPRGSPGSKILKGQGPPTPSIGGNNDYYIDTSGPNVLLYGPKVDDTWPSEVILLSGPTSRFVFNQQSPSDTWTIDHTLGGFPSVSIVDSADTVVFGMITYINESRIILTFSAPFSGKAYLT